MDNSLWNLIKLNFKLYSRINKFKGKNFKILQSN